VIGGSRLGTRTAACCQRNPADPVACLLTRGRYQAQLCAVTGCDPEPDAPGVAADAVRQTAPREDMTRPGNLAEARQ
jgi:hypothetical protein